jgi:hypothetical protein
MRMSIALRCIYLISVRSLRSKWDNILAHLQRYYSSPTARISLLYLFSSAQSIRTQKRLLVSFLHHIWFKKTHFSSSRVTSVIGILPLPIYAPRLLKYDPSRGTRFSYTYYYPEPPPSTTPAVRLSKSGPQPTTHPIHESISALDHEAMDILTVPEKSTAEEVHGKFASYLARTHNTICGRHPIGVLLGALAVLKREERHEPRIKWVRYEQSSQCKTVYDSSVSYASAYVTL